MTLDLTNFQKALLFFLILACLHYLYIVFENRVLKAVFDADISEGFENGDQAMNESETRQDVITIYDKFYAKIYNLLTQNQGRTFGKVALSMNSWKKTSNPDVSKWSVLDAGCGTGQACQAFAKMGVGSVVGVDISAPMLEQAQIDLEKSEVLDAEQKKLIHFRNDNLMNPSACSAGEFSHIVVYYFTIYYLQDMETFFRNCNMWSLPNGKLAVEVVNKYKFDPILEPANPLVGFSLQKYFEKRVTQSKISFNTFDYTGEFNLHDPKAEFRETFYFKDKTITPRRQVHQFTMPNIQDIIKNASLAGWKYTGFIDLMPADFEYGYLVLFSKER
jgi:2-polyprenyl-3-methyl-5-hydroxy-6-metoxy-1,4-benzoquinol methylase